jgi:PAS domain S-box-containing protein
MSSPSIPSHSKGVQGIGYERLESLLQGQSDILEMISRGGSLITILESITQWVEQQAGHTLFASILLVNKEGNRLLHGAAPSLPEEYNNAIHGVEIGANTGSCGTAAFLGETVIVENIETDPRWSNYKEVAAAAGLKACWSTPLLSKDGKVLGTFAIYYAQAKTPTPDELLIIRLVSRTAVIAIENARNEERTKKLLSRVSSAQQLAELAVSGANAGTFHVNLADDDIAYSLSLSSILTGREQTGLTRKVFVDHLHPDDIIVRDLAYKEAAHTKHIDYEARFIWEDGSIHWVRVLGRYLTNKKGEPVSLAGIVLDITNEKNLRNRQQQLLSLVENSNDYMGVADLEGNIIYVNPSGRQLVGLPLEGPLPKLTNRDFYSPEHFEYIKTVVLPPLLKHGRWSGVIHFRHFITGETIPCNADFVCIYDPVTQNMIGRGAAIRDLRPEINAKELLATSESRFRLAIEQSPVAMGMLKGPGLIIETANDPLLEIWGKDRSVIGLPLLQGLPELIDQPFPALLQEVMQTARPHYGYDALARLVRNGVLGNYYFNFVYAPYYENGVVAGVQVVANEVTAQVLAKKELQDSEARFRNLVSDAPVATAIYSGRGMLISLANDAMLNLWGKGPEVIGKYLHEGLPELEGQPFLQLLDDVFTTGKEYSAKEARADLVVDGRLQTFYFNFTYRPLHDASGNIYAILNMAVDVTDSVISRQKLAGAEERVRLAAEGTGLGTWDLDLVSRHIIYSPNLNEIFGWQPGHLMTHADMRSQIHPDDIHTVVEPAFELALRSGIYDYEARVIRPDASIKWIKTQGRIIYARDGKPMRMVGTMTDITVEKNARIALEESEERYRKLATELETRVQERTRDLQKVNQSLEKSNAELAQYAYVASHDLQEPLRKIRVFSSMLRDRNELSEAASDLLQRVMASSDRMSQLINDLLEFSRLLNAGKAMRMTDLNEVIQNVMNDFELSITEKQALIEVGELPAVEAVPLQMNQLFYNLMSNALKFARDGVPPRISIQAEEVSPEAMEQNGLARRQKYFRIRFTDNGIGFDSKYAEQVFEVFKRLHNRQAYPGSGIGLALCRKIAENHNGWLYAESDETKGTVFHVVLPEKQ